jgi:hypothetical protein
MSLSVPRSRRARRILDLALALLILLLGVGTVVVVSERSRDVSAGESLVTLDDVNRAILGRGLDVSLTGRMVDVPGLDLMGHVVQVNDDTITVVLFASVADRVIAEQQLIARNHLFSASLDNQGDLPTLLSARNALVVHLIAHGSLVQSVSAAIMDLAGSIR